MPEHVPSPRPPGVFRLLLAALLPHRLRAEQLADLDEEYRIRVSEGRRARSWYRWQVVRSLLPALACRLRDRPAGALVVSHLVDDSLGVARTLGRRPGFALTVTLLLALGIGATSAAFSVVQAVWLRPLPYPNADRIVYVSGSGLDAERLGEHAPGLSAFSEIAVHGVVEVTIQGIGAPTRTTLMPVSERYFDIVGVQPAVGRGLAAFDHAAGSDPVAVVGAGLAQRRLGGLREALGAQLLIDGRTFTVVGVMPPDFAFHRFPSTEAWIPIAHWPEGGRRVLGRLRDGVGIGVAVTEMNAVRERISRANAEDGRGTVSVQRLRDAVVGFYRDGLIVLTGVVALVMLIAIANVSSLMLVRNERRGHELAVRAALGAGRFRLVRHVAMEALVLATAASLLGVALGHWAAGTLISMQPTPLPRAQEVGVDAGVVAFSFAVGLACTLVASLPPALTLPPHVGARSESARAGRASVRVRSALVVGEVAIASAMSVGAAVLLRTYLILVPTDPGFEARDRLAFRLELPVHEYTDPAARAALFESLRGELARLPGAGDVSMVTDLPMTETNLAFRLAPPGSDGGEGALRAVHVRAATPNYLSSLEMPIVSGRGIEPTDRLGTQDVAVVNEAMAAAFWPDGDPLGRLLRLPTAERGPIAALVVGVVADAWISPGRAESRPEVFVPFAQERPASVAYVIATPVPEILVSAVLEAAGRHAPGGAVRGPNGRHDRPRPLEEVLSDAMAPWRYQLALVGCFAGLALVLATAGVYAVLSAAVGRERPAIAIRMALGGTPAAVGTSVLRRGLTLVVGGLGVGLLAAAAGTRVLASFLYGVSPLDPLSYLAVVVTVVAVGVGACAVPVRRATSTEPMAVLSAD